MSGVFAVAFLCAWCSGRNEFHAVPATDRRSR